MLKVIPLLVFTLFPGALLAEHPACTQLPFDFTVLESQTLRSIATSCQSRAFQNLNYNRAYYQDLQSGFSAYSTMGFLSATRNRNPGKHGRAYGMYIQLAEAFAPNAGGSVYQQAELLNRVYEDANEIAELRLKGYQSRADWLEAHRPRGGG